MRSVTASFELNCVLVRLQRETSGLVAAGVLAGFEGSIDEWGVLCSFRGVVVNVGVKDPLVNEGDCMTALFFRLTISCSKRSILQYQPVGISS